MRSNWASFVSAIGIPILGLGGLLFSLWHSNVVTAPNRVEQEMIYLQEPSPSLDRSLTICLRQQAKEVAICRARMRREGIAQAVADYNLVAQECTPAVFAATHLPSSLEP